MEHGADQVLIVDDDRDIGRLLSTLMNKGGLASQVAYDGETALQMLAAQAPDLLLVDVKMPGLDGMELLKRVKETDPQLPVVLITAYAEISGSVAAMKAGAFDYLAKPFDHTEVMRVVRAALSERQRRRQAGVEDIPADNVLRVMMGPSDAVTRIIREVNRVSQSDFSVIIQGETGAGKELVARAVHQLSRRAAAPFIPLDCGAIPETLIESELFGYQKGAFTGATASKMGKFEAAQGGTLFLDEIANLPVSSQTRLLRVLQEKAVLRLGALKPIEIDVRLLTASNQKLLGLVESGQMREDIYFRLNEFTITIPPLRERREDIPYLAKRFLDITNRELQKNVQGFSKVLPGGPVVLQLAGERAPAPGRHPSGRAPGRRFRHRKAPGDQTRPGAGPGLHPPGRRHPLAGDVPQGDRPSQRGHGGAGGPGPGPEIHRRQ